MSSYDDLLDENDYEPFYMKDADIYFSHFYSIAELANGEVFKVIFDAETEKFKFSGMGSSNSKIQVKIKNKDILDFEIKKDTKMKIKNVNYIVKNVLYDEYGVSSLTLNCLGEGNERYTEEL